MQKRDRSPGSPGGSRKLHKVDDADNAPQDNRQSQGPSAPSIIRPDDVTASIKREDLVALGQSLLNHDVYGISLNDRNDTPLRLAARLGKLRVVEWLVHERHAAVNQADTDGRTPLYIAAQEGHLAVVTWLVSAGGAAVNQTKNNGWTPLLIAALVGHVHIVEVLLDAGRASDSGSVLARVTPERNASHVHVLLLCFAPGLSAAEVQRRELASAVALAGKVNSAVDDVRQLLLGDDMWAYLPVRPLLLLVFEYVRSRVEICCLLGMPAVE
jgi:ankyrin repeat protein